VVFCVVYELTGSIFPVIALHAFNNAIAYGASTDGATGLSVGLGLAMIAAAVIVPGLMSKKAPA
jgi:membrane protease YdiL (CAAX protease family)